MITDSTDAVEIVTFSDTFENSQTLLLLNIYNIIKHNRIKRIKNQIENKIYLHIILLRSE